MKKIFLFLSLLASATNLHCTKEGVRTIKTIKTIYTQVELQAIREKLKETKRVALERKNTKKQLTLNRQSARKNKNN